MDVYELDRQDNAFSVCQTIRVSAEDEEQARGLAYGFLLANDLRPEVFLDPKQSTCRVISPTSRPPSIVQTIHIGGDPEDDIVTRDY